MKVTNDQLEALLRQQSQTPGTTRAQTAQGGFEAALREQMGLENAVASPASPTAAAGQTSQASMISQMLLGSTQSESVDVDEDVIQSAFSQASGTLYMWDSYVNALGSSGQNGSLREAYSLLQGQLFFPQHKVLHLGMGWARLLRLVAAKRENGQPQGHEQPQTKFFLTKPAHYKHPCSSVGKHHPACPFACNLPA